MRLARCLPLLVAAVTSALPTSSSPERSQDPAVSSDKNNNADLIGASVMTTGSVSAALYMKSLVDEFECEDETTEFWNQFLSAFSMAQYNEYQTIMRTLHEICRNAKSRAKLRAHIRAQKEEALRNSQSNVNAPEPEIMYPKKMNRKTDNRPVGTDDSASPNSIVATTTEEPAPPSNGDDTWNNVAGAVGSGITLGTMGIAAGSQFLAGGDAANGAVQAGV